MSATPTPTTQISLRSVHAALRKTTEFLALEVGRGATEAPRWSPTEWQVARAAASIHGVSGLLAHQPRWRGPEDWECFLAEQSADIASRLTRIRELLRGLDAPARDRGIALVVLKGAALHAQGLYREGERPMADIDLLVAETDADRATQLLAELGFRESLATWKHRAFEPIEDTQVAGAFGENWANPIKIELHSQIREIFPVRPVDLSDLVFPRHPHPGLNTYASNAGMLLHVLLHAAGAMVLRAVRLVHLNDVARLTRRMAPQDWDDLFDQAASTADPTLWWAYPPLALTHRYYDCVPAPVLERCAAGCRALLRHLYRRRTLSDVSLSYLWVSAFPGIEWSRTLREMLDYAAQRIRPSRETLALRQAFAQSQPLVSGGEWAQTSQGRRILRWLLARQPRQETLQPVRASLAQPLQASR